MIINKVLKFNILFVFGIALIALIGCRLQSENKKSLNEDYYSIKVDSQTTDIVEKYEQPISYSSNVLNPIIKSIQLSNESLNAVEPCYFLNSDKKVNVDFDLIESNPVPLQYEIIHCNMSWEKSDLMEMEYLNGFSTNYIEDVELSHGTQEQYVHYHFKLPNENIEFIKSGNYILNVFYENDNENPIFNLKFFVSEESAKATFNITRTTDVEQRNYVHAVELECNYNYNSVNDPYQNIFICVQQNHQEFDEIWFSEPNFIRDDKLTFLPNEDRVFNGGNEFRFFDMSSFRTGGQNTRSINLENNQYKVNLKSGNKRTYKQYLEYKDFNGKFFTRSFDNNDIETQGDYGLVYFTLPMRKINGEIYAFGQFSNWSIQEEFLMQYDSINEQYFNNILLKQGYYNYIYVHKDKSGLNTRDIEGAHYDANNEYIIKVYYRDPLGLYDRLLHYQVYNTKT